MTELPAEPTIDGPGDQDQEVTPAALLGQALEGLQAGQRQQVLQWLLERIPAASSAMDATGAWSPSAGSDLVRTRRAHERAVQEVLLGLSDPSRGDYQMVPVRLPADDHARLRTWLQEHGFAMATVIRGLLARFLDEHQARPATAD